MTDATTGARPSHGPGSVAPSPPQPDAQRVYLNVNQLSERYSVHPVTVWRWVREAGFPPPVRFSSNCTRWRLSDVEGWESQRFAEAC